MQPHSNRSRILSILVLIPVLSGMFLLTSGTSQARHDAVIIEGMPAVQQWYNLSCEYAAAAAVTLYWGNLVSQRDFMAEIPRHPNPHIGFRGNIHGDHGWIDDYGIYAEPLVPVLERRGYDATVFYGNDVERLKANISAGNPAVVWLTTGRYDRRPQFFREYEGETFKLVPFEHAIVAYGYDGDGIYSMDVGSGAFVYTDWSSFLRRWAYFDGMTLIIRPAW
jgi:uncharacterized protein YvpB